MSFINLCEKNQPERKKNDKEASGSKEKVEKGIETQNREIGNSIQINRYDDQKSATIRVFTNLDLILFFSPSGLNR